MRLNRADRSLLSDWWFTVDRLTLLAVVLLMIGGLVLSLAASPPVAQKLGLEPFHFVKRHALFLVPGLLTVVAASLLTPRLIRRASLILFIGGTVLMALALLTGPEIKGATRWLQFGIFSIQPSEVAKPAAVILCAWLFSESRTRKDMPSLHIAIAVYAVFTGLLILQPDFGQALLFTLVWGGLFFMAGMPMFWVWAIAGGVVAAVAAAYLTLPHVTTRIDSFFDPGAGDTYQTDRAMQSFKSGGWFGTGPGEGTVKQFLPDSHTDFIFAVVAEEYGLVACLALLLLFAFIVLRAMLRAHAEPDGFIRLGVTGLMLLFGLQALINMAVNVGLLPAKGMTLPFISYGGSSLMAMSVAMGFALGLTRRRPRARAREAPGVHPASRELEA